MYSMMLLAVEGLIGDFFAEEITMGDLLMLNLDLRDCFVLGVEFKRLSAIFKGGDY